MYMILIYDIDLAEEEEKRKADAKVMRKVFKICKKYLTHIQKSVFEGELSEVQLIKLKSELKEVLRRDRDSCIVFRAWNNKWMKKEFVTDEVEQITTFL